jgi:hypothetical protein
LKLKNPSSWVISPQNVADGTVGSQEQDLVWDTQISQKKQTFILITRSFLGFWMDVHPDVYKDGGSFPNANPPSESEDDFGDKRTAAETYFNN